MDKIHSITYDKSKGEYEIICRDDITGKRTITTANHLTEDEKSWATLNRNARREDPWKIHWTISHTTREA